MSKAFFCSAWGRKISKDQKKMSARWKSVNAISYYSIMLPQATATQANFHPPGTPVFHYELSTTKMCVLHQSSTICSEKISDNFEILFCNRNFGLYVNLGRFQEDFIWVSKRTQWNRPPRCLSSSNTPVFGENSRAGSKKYEKHPWSLYILELIIPWIISVFRTLDNS